MQTNCAVKGCPNFGRYCRRVHGSSEASEEAQEAPIISSPVRTAGLKVKKPEKGLKKPIPKMSKKRAKLERTVLKEVRKKLKENSGDECEIRSPVCIGRPTFPQHIKGRTGIKNLTDITEMKSSCNPCNDYIEEQPAWAKKHGFKKSMHDTDYKRSK